MFLKETGEVIDDTIDNVIDGRQCDAAARRHRLLSASVPNVKKGSGE